MKEPKGKDYYEILGVPKNASLKEIKSAFRKLVKLYHPDLFPNDEEKAERFRLIKEAYDVLANKEKREVYDKFGTTQVGDGREYFESTFVTSQGNRSCDDIILDVYIAPEEGIKEKRLSFQRLELCELCKGKGTLNSSSNWQTCPTCKGAGRKKKVKIDLFSEHITYERCPDCGGRGTLPTIPCPRCGGKGTIRKQEEISIKIPTKVREGERLIFKGLGNECPDGGKGDLIVVFHIASKNSRNC
ncbi:J domain-containing protein [bacterium]|nr:J domain-containing protein [bacterium]